MDTRLILSDHTLIGTLVGALIGGGVATISAVLARRSTKDALTVTERQLALTHAIKIADFRQAWINDLRETMAKWQSFSLFPRQDETSKEKEESAQEFNRLRGKILLADGLQR